MLKDHFIFHIEIATLHICGGEFCTLSTKDVESWRGEKREEGNACKLEKLAAFINRRGSLVLKSRPDQIQTVFTEFVHRKLSSRFAYEKN